MYLYVKSVLAMTLTCSGMAFICFFFPFLLLPEDIYTFSEILQESLDFSKFVFMITFITMVITFVVLDLCNRLFTK